MLIKYTIQITWFVTDSHTKVTSPRTGRNAFAVELEFLRSSSVLTASTLSLRHGRTTKPKRTAKPWRETWGSPCHLYQLRSTWQWAALEVEAQQAACFLQYCSMSNVTEYVTYLLNNIILIIKIFLANEWTDLLGFAGGSAGHRGRG